MARSSIITAQFTRMTLESAYYHFILEKRAIGLSEATLQTYITDYNVLIKYVDPKKRIQLCKSEDIREAFVQMASKDISRNTIRHYSATWKSFFSWCRENCLCDVSFPLYKGEESVPQTYTEADLQKLLKKPNLSKCGFVEFRNWTIINLLVNDGCRAGTVRAIQNRDVHLSECVIFLRHTKRRKSLTIPLCDSLVAILGRYMQIRKGAPTDYLFCNEDGSQMTSAGLASAIERYNKKRGVALCSLHAFRHTFARMYLIDCEGDSLKLQKILGHETLDMTKHYLKVFDADIVSDRQRSPLEKLQAGKRIKMK